MCEDRSVGHGTVRFEELDWEERPSTGGVDRLAADLTSAVGLTQSRARIWRYPPGARGKRHRENGQEEVFVVLDGRLTVLLGDEPERVEIGRHGVVAVERGTALQVRNDGDQELVLLVYGAPPVTGAAEILDEVEP